MEAAEELGPKMMEDNAVMALAPLPPKEAAARRKGPSIKDVPKLFGILDISLDFVCISRSLSILFIRKINYFTPSQECGYHL